MNSLNRLKYIALLLILSPSLSWGEEKGLLEAFGADSLVTKKGQIGFSTTLNTTRFYLDGRYDILAAGVGFGASWKKETQSNFPLEVGLYAAPQFAKSVEGEDSEGSLSLLLQATLWNRLGLGVGFDAWFTSGGVSPEGLDGSDRFFVTIGYGLTNETEK